MPVYSYTVKDESGRAKTDMAEALNEQSLVEKLQADGYFVLSVKPAFQGDRNALLKSRSKTPKRNKVRIDDMLVFSRQLATMLEAGVSLVHSLDIINEQVDSKEMSNTLKQIRDEVEAGKPLSNCMAKHPKVFNQFWISLVEVGEASGTMPKILNRLAFYTEQQAGFRTLIVSAMIYPGVLLFVTMAAVSFFALFIGPKFESIFKDMGAKLPGITIAVLGVFKFIENDWFFILAAGMVAYTLFRQYIKTDYGRLVFERFLFNLPLLGPVYKLVIVERFVSQMATLVESGVPILYALEICEKMVDNKTCAIVIVQVREAVRDGKSLSEPIGNSGFFPFMASQMIKVGEETGELGKMLNHVSTYYLSNVEAFMKRFGTLIEPFMLVFMGFMVGTIVIAMFLPLINLSSGGK